MTPHLIRSSTKKFSAGALPIRLFSSYALDFLPLGFITKATCTCDYSTVTLFYQAVGWMIEIDIDVLEKQAYATSS